MSSICSVPPNIALRLAATCLWWCRAAALPLILLVAIPAPLLAADRLPGPIPAAVLRVVDGDTVDVRAHIWLGQTVDIRVRLAGIDAPELRGKCAYEKQRAQAAKTRLEALATDSHVTLTDIARGKFAGRVLAQVVRLDGVNLATTLQAEGLARAYDGGRRGDWCAEARLQEPYLTPQ